MRTESGNYKTGGHAGTVQIFVDNGNLLSKLLSTAAPPNLVQF